MNTTKTHDIFSSLNNLMNIYPDNVNDQSKKEIENFLMFCLAGMETDSQKFLATLFLKALNKKIGAETINEHIYLKKYEIPQIHLFDILIKKFPFVKFSQQMINQEIINIMNDSQEITIIDIGIGLGTQLMNIIELSKNLPQLKKITIVGIEPFSDALVLAEKNIKALQQSTAFEITFIGINDFAENIDFTTIPNIGGKIIVNASLALHHLQTQTQRSQTIANIKKINPTAFFLTEPNVNHFEPDFHQRFQNCYKHFYSIFQVIDRIDISETDKNALKLFFGREIEDIIGNEEKDRYERHEPATQWINKLNEVGFTLRNDLLKSPFETSEGLSIKNHPEGFCGFTYEDETVLSLMYAN